MGKEKKREKRKVWWGCQRNGEYFAGKTGTQSVSKQIKTFLTVGH